jgi:uncharacterized protein (DUF2147 family)
MKRIQILTAPRRLAAWLLLFGLTFAFSTAFAPTLSADAIVGVWLTENGKSKVQVVKAANGTYTGTIIWLRDPIDPDTGQPKLDKKNPVPSLRSRPLIGLTIAFGFKYDDDEWNNGRLYDPESGNTYSGYMEFEDSNNLNKLKLRGYVGVSLIGRTSHWTRVQ